MNLLSSQPIDPARLCLKSVRLELVERRGGFDKLSPNGVNTSPCRINSQRGATLVVSLILLTLMTLMVTTAFTLTTSNLKSVSNMRFRNEAIAAANIAIEQKIGALCPPPCTTAPAADPIIKIDINRDSISDYDVAIATPTCVQASISTNGTRSSMSLGSGMSSGDFWNTVWDIDATVTDPVSGALIKIRSGTRLLLSQTQKNTVCP